MFRRALCCTKDEIYALTFLSRENIRLTCPTARGAYTRVWIHLFVFILYILCVYCIFVQYTRVAILLTISTVLDKAYIYSLSILIR